MDVIELTKALISCQSVTPKNDGVLDLLEKELSNIGFDCRRYLFSDSNTPDVDNLFAKIGSGAPHICFGGHTDVVPVGDIDAWSFDPFNYRPAWSPRFLTVIFIGAKLPPDTL